MLRTLSPLRLPPIARSTPGQGGWSATVSAHDRICRLIEASVKSSVEVWSLMPYCPRSSLSAAVLAWLVDRLAHLRPRPPGAGGRCRCPLEVRVDAVAAVVLDGLSYRRAGRMVGISKTEAGDSMDL